MALDAALVRHDGWKPFELCNYCVDDCVSECFWSLAKKRARSQKINGATIIRFPGLREGSGNQNNGDAGKRRSGIDRSLNGSESINDGDSRRAGSRQTEAPVSKLGNFLSKKEQEIEGIDREAAAIITRAEADIDMKIKILHQNILILEDATQQLADQLGVNLDD